MLWFSFRYSYYEKFNFKILKKKVYNSNNDQSAKKSGIGVEFLEYFPLSHIES